VHPTQQSQLLNIKTSYGFRNAITSKSINEPAIPAGTKASDSKPLALDSFVDSDPDLSSLDLSSDKEPILPVREKSVESSSAFKVEGPKIPAGTADK